MVQPKELVKFPGIVRNMTCTTAQAEGQHGLDMKDVAEDGKVAMLLLVERITANVPDLEWFTLHLGLTFY